jgi:hypothetical protein
LLERADAGAARSTLTVALAAIKFGHRIAGQRFDGADPELVRALAGARREAVQEQRQAAPLRPAILSDVLAGLGDGELDRRDAAMLATLAATTARMSLPRSATLGWIIATTLLDRTFLWWTCRRSCVMTFALFF